LAALGAYRDWAMIAGRTVRDMQLTSPVRAGTTLRATLVIGPVRSRLSQASSAGGSDGSGNLGRVASWPAS
jgi:hypothetical protein